MTHINQEVAHDCGECDFGRLLFGAQATVRVWSTGHARFRLGYGLTKGHPRVERTRARHRPSFAKEGRPHVLAPARKAKRQREHSHRIEEAGDRKSVVEGKSVDCGGWG